MTGITQLNYPAFFEAEKKLQAAGYETENPANNVTDSPTWLNYMRMSLVQISKVDGIALLPEWGQSRGARIEHDLALSLGLEVRYLLDWLEPDRFNKND